jgi:hypothetical protein
MTYFSGTMLVLGTFDVPIPIEPENQPDFSVSTMSANTLTTP